MKKFRFYFVGIENAVYIEANSFEDAVEIAYTKEVDVDVDRTVLAFFKDN